MDKRIAALLLTGFLLAPALAQTDDIPPRTQVVSWTVFRPTTGETFFFCEDSLISPCPGPGIVQAQNFQHEELDLVQIRLRITDFDWDIALEELNATEVGMDEDIPEPPDYDDVYVGTYMIGNFDAPAAPLIPEISVFWPADLVALEPNTPLLFLRSEELAQFFGSDSEDMNGFTPTQDFTFGSDPPPFTDLTISLQIPAFVGQDQTRLETGVGFDIAYLLFIDVSNEDDPDESSLFNVPAGVSRNIVQIGAIQSPALAPPNPQAIADASASATLVASGTRVTLDGSGSFDSTNTGIDPDDDRILEKDTLTYVWEWVSGPVRVDPVQTSSEDPLADVVLTALTPTDGSNPYVYRLLVDDGVNAIPNAATVEIEVVGTLPPNQPPTVSIVGPGAPVLAGETVTLDGSGSADPEGGDLKFRWVQTNALGGELEQAEVNDVFQPLSGLDGPTATWQALIPGRYYFRLLVSDSGFTSSTRFTVDVIEPLVNGQQFVFEDLNAAAKDLAGLDGSVPESPRDVPNPTAHVLIGVPHHCGFGILMLGFTPLGMIALRRRR